MCASVQACHCVRACLSECVYGYVYACLCACLCVCVGVLCVLCTYEYECVCLCTRQGWSEGKMRKRVSTLVTSLIFELVREYLVF